MPFFGKCWTAAFGPTQHQLEYIRGEPFAGGIRTFIKIRPRYRERNYAIFCGGVYITTKYCDESGLIQITLLPGLSPANMSVYIEDVGLRTQFNTEDIPYISMNARRNDGLTAQKLGFEWDVIGKYKLSAAYGDSSNQLSNIQITGARKCVNVEPVDGFVSKGRLYYTITTGTSGKIVRFYAGDYLVAEGSTDTTTVTCTERMESGLTITADLTFVSDIKKGSAWIDLLWPSKYHLHYSLLPLVFPRTPEITFDDNGGEEYVLQTGDLPVGDYFWNILAVFPEGIIESAPEVPTDQKAIRYIPAAPTITDIEYSPTGNEYVVTFTNGEAGCTYKAYYNNKGRAINYGDMSGGPAPVGPTALNATTITIPAFDDPSADDYSTDYDTAETAFDNFVAAVNASFTADKNTTDYLTTLETEKETLFSALLTFGNSLGLELRSKKDQFNQRYENLYTQVESYLEWGLTPNEESGTIGFDTAGFDEDFEWFTQIGVLHGQFLAFLGELLEDNPKRYSLPNGGIAGTVQGADGDGLTENSINDVGSRSGTSLLGLASPFVRNAIMRVVVRATKSGNESQNGNFYEVELNEDGSIIGKRPNPCALLSLVPEFMQEEAEETPLDVIGSLPMGEVPMGGGGGGGILSYFNLTITGEYLTSDQPESPAFFDCYVVPYSSIIDLSTPTVSVAASDFVRNHCIFTFDPIMVYPAGWFKVALVARTSEGIRSEIYEERLVHLSDQSPAGVNKKAFTIRSKGA